MLSGALPRLLVALLGLMPAPLGLMAALLRLIATLSSLVAALLGLLAPLSRRRLFRLSRGCSTGRLLAALRRLLSLLLG